MLINFNQVEIHEYFQQKPLRKFCTEKNIVATAYAPLGSNDKREIANPNKTQENFPNLLQLPVIKEIGKKYKKSNAHIMLRHFIQEGIAVIPKSTHAKRLKENIDIFDFELSNEDIKTLDALDKGKEGRVFNFLNLKG